MSISAILELTRKIKASYPETVVIVLTDYDTPEYRKAAFQCGASCFFAKDSLDWGQFETMIKSHISRQGTCNLGMGVLESQELLALKFTANHSTTLSLRLPSHQEEKLQKFSKIVKLDCPEIRNNDPFRPGGGKLCLIVLFVLKV